MSPKASRHGPGYLSKCSPHHLPITCRLTEDFPDGPWPGMSTNEHTWLRWAGIPGHQEGWGGQQGGEVAHRGWPLGEYARNSGVLSEGQGASAEVCFWAGQGGPQFSGTSGLNCSLGQSDTGSGSRRPPCSTQAGRRASGHRAVGSLPTAQHTCLLSGIPSLRFLPQASPQAFLEAPLPPTHPPEHLARPSQPHSISGTKNSMLSQVEPILPLALAQFWLEHRPPSPVSLHPPPLLGLQASGTSPTPERGGRRAGENTAPFPPHVQLPQAIELSPRFCWGLETGGGGMHS